MDTTTTKDNMAEDSNGGARRDGALVERVTGHSEDRTLWRSIVVALCPTGNEEDQ